MGFDYVIKDLVSLIFIQGLEIIELGKYFRNQEQLFLNLMVEFIVLKWYNLQFFFFRNVKFCLSGNLYIYDKLENNLEVIYKMYREFQFVYVISR